MVASLGVAACSIMGVSTWSSAHTLLFISYWKESVCLLWVLYRIVVLWFVSLVWFAGVVVRACLLNGSRALTLRSPLGVLALVV